MYRTAIKRIIDIAVSFTAIIVLLLPFLLITIYLAIRIKGNPFFFQDRPGLNGKIFKMIKYKTMTDERDSSGELLSDRERLTNIGRVLRRTSLDEIPELLNIFKGDMSLVGPRPLLVKYLPYYTERENRRHEVRPGITGLSQVSGRHLLKWDERLELDVQYVEKLNFLLDLKIIYATFLQVLKQKDVMEVSSDVMPDFDSYRKSQTR